MRPCKECVKHGLVCCVGPGSGRCLECVRSTHRKCDLVVSEQEWSRVERDRVRLHAECQEALSRFVRLRKERDLAEKRWEEMVQREFQNIEELEADEAQESSEATTVPSLDDFLLNVSSDQVEMPMGFDPSYWPEHVPSQGSAS